MNKRELDRNIDLAIAEGRTIKRVVLSSGDLMLIMQHLSNFNYPLQEAGLHYQYRGVQLVCSEE